MFRASTPVSTESSSGTPSPSRVSSRNSLDDWLDLNGAIHVIEYSGESSLSSASRSSLPRSPSPDSTTVFDVIVRSYLSNVVLTPGHPFVAGIRLTPIDGEIALPRGEVFEIRECNEEEALQQYVDNIVNRHLADYYLPDIHYGLMGNNIQCTGNKVAINGPSQLRRDANEQQLHYSVPIKVEGQRQVHMLLQGMRDRGPMTFMTASLEVELCID